METSIVLTWEFWLAAALFLVGATVLIFACTALFYLCCLSFERLVDKHLNKA
jgi:hypothetical protein